MTDASVNHGRSKLSPELYEREASLHGMLLEDAVRFIQATASGEYRFLADLLKEAEVYPGIAGLDVDCAAIRLPSATGKRVVFSYTWDWLENNNLNERADALAQKLITAVEEGTLSRPQHA